MKLTKAQDYYLTWLHKAGGGYPHGMAIKAANSDERTTTASGITFVNLFVKGLVEAKNGMLRVTAMGRRQLGLPESESAP